MTPGSLRRRCRKAAARLGCTVEAERCGRLYTYWVFGPRGVYGPPDTVGAEFRADPCFGNHCWADWSEVESALGVYRVDLHLNHFDVPSALARRIADEADPPLLAGWVDNQADHDRALVLADSLEEAGNDDLAGVLRGAVASGPQGV